MGELNTTGLDDTPAWERVESFAGGEDSYRRATLIDPDQSQKLVNMVVRDNYEARTRPGADSIGPLLSLATPTALTATAAGPTEIDLAWTNNVTGDNVIVSRSLTAGGAYVDVATLAGTATSYADTGLQQSVRYYYAVRARTNNGNASPKSAQATAQTKPAAPSSLSATALDDWQINLAWVDNSTGEASFIVARSLVSGSGYVDIATVGANVTAYADIGLTPSTTYYYKVRARDTVADSANSNEAGAATSANLGTAMPVVHLNSGIPPVKLFQNGFNYPAGNYRVTYVSGAMKFGSAFGWDSGGGYALSQGMVIKYNNGAATKVAPGTGSDYSTVVACESANNLLHVDFVHTGGTIGIFLVDSDYTDNQSAPLPSSSTVYQLNHKPGV